ncbi:MAG: OmpA family protein [Candidatus Acidiferrum sp.]
MRKRFFCPVLLLFSAAFVLSVSSSFAQSASETGTLKIQVTPKQAYVFVDGKAIRDGSQSIALAAGDHKVGVYNYGYLPKLEKVHIGAGEKTDLVVRLQSSGDVVAGPFADIEFKGHPRAAVLLNGQTPAYFVGHVDEFDWNWIWHQRLLVHSGTYQVTVTREGNTIWSGPITAKAGQQITIYLDHDGKTKTKEWKEGLNMPPQPRFHAGIASATVPVAPVTTQFTAQNSNVACGQNATLNWTSENAIDTSISGIGEVPTYGDRTVSPTGKTTYVLTAKGPGGDSTQSITVDVNIQPTASISLSKPEVTYKKVGDKVVEQGSTTLDWSTSHANSALVSPLGSESMSGSRTVTANPKSDSIGPVNEDETYTLTATNACGGTTTKTATFHIVGSIEPPPPVTLASLFYPTAYPTRRHPKAGLVASEKKQLIDIAAHFKAYEPYDHKGNLLILAHADIRGPKRYNQSLSERRAVLIKDFLVAQGVPADKIEIRADGKEQQLAMQKVAALQSQDPEKPAKWEARHRKTTWLAYNRRADIILEPRDILSAEDYPNDVTYVRLLWQRPEPSLKKIQMAGKLPASSQSLSASSTAAAN